MNPWIKFCLFLKDFFARTRTSKSGKRTKTSGWVKVFDKDLHLAIRANEDGTVDYTLDEIAAMAIRCAWCGEPIAIGDPVTLYLARPGIAIPPHAVRYNHQSLVGCLGWNCAETGADRAGFWEPDPDQPGKGRVRRVPSPFEMLIANPDARFVINNNLGDATHETQVYRK